MYTVISYETADLEICTRAEKGGRVRAIYHAFRRARWYEQEITCVRILGEGLSWETALALLWASKPGDGIAVPMCEGV